MNALPLQILHSHRLERWENDSSEMSCRNSYRKLPETTKLSSKVVLETWEQSGKRVRDYTLYTGVLGTASLLFKSYNVSRNENELKLCLEIDEACDVASRDSERVTFICGHAGVCALGAVIGNCISDERLQDNLVVMILMLLCFLVLSSFFNPENT